MIVVTVLESGRRIALQNVDVERVIDRAADDGGGCLVRVHCAAIAGKDQAPAGYVGAVDAADAELIAVREPFADVVAMVEGKPGGVACPPSILHDTPEIDAGAKIGELEELNSVLAKDRNAVMKSLNAAGIQRVTNDDVRRGMAPSERVAVLLGEWYDALRREAEKAKTISEMREAFHQILGWRENDRPEGGDALHVVRMIEDIARKQLEAAL